MVAGGLRKMNILYICTTDPRLCSFGSEQRTHNLYNALLKLGSVYTLSFGVTNRDPDNRISPMPPVLSKIDFVRLINAIGSRIFRMLCPKGPLQFLPCPRAFSLETVFPDVYFDVVVMRYMGYAGALHPWRIAPTFIDIDDHPLQVFDTVCTDQMSGVRRKVARLTVSLLYWWVMRHLQGAWIANPTQVSDDTTRKVACLCNLAPELSVNYNPDAVRKPLLMTVGLMDYKPNINGVANFVQEVWPRVRAAYPDFEYWIVGRNAPADLVKHWHQIEGVKYCGFVRDLDSVYEKALATVVPISQGGGTCIKTLESLSRSRVCLSTPFGARGVPEEDLKDGRNGICIFKDADDFLGILNRVVNSESVRKERESAGCAYIKAHYSLSEFERAVREMIELHQ